MIFLKKKKMILVSTTVIEVGVNIPSATLMIIEDANRFGLSQLHQLRGRVGRGEKQGICILLFKEGLSKNAIKRIKILKSTAIQEMTEFLKKKQPIDHPLHKSIGFKIIGFSTKPSIVKVHSSVLSLSELNIGSLLPDPSS